MYQQPGLGAICCATSSSQGASHENQVSVDQSLVGRDHCFVPRHRLGTGGAGAQQPQSIFIEGDMVRGNTGKGQTGPTCVLNSQFRRNENAVFRVRVRDIFGKPLDDKGIQGVAIELSDGQKLNMRYGGHPPRGSVDYFWSAGWLIPDDYPTGTLYYKIVATDLQGRTQTWQSFQDPRSQIVVIPGAVQYSGEPQVAR
jgi:hypothetical protein